ncbi:MAG: hypothetical protein M3N57_13605 [Actinomycetota bacterium]|nr:hypothetical protein [Actinomycetota bacterium]
MTVRDRGRERRVTGAEPVLGIGLVALAAAAISVIGFAIAVAVSLVF